MKALVLVLSVLLFCGAGYSQAVKVTSTATVDTAVTSLTSLVNRNQLNNAIAKAIAALGFTGIPGDSTQYLAKDGKFHATVELRSRPGYFLVDSAGVLVARGFFLGTPTDTVVTLGTLRSFFGSSPGGLPAGVVVDTLKLLKMK